MFNKYPLISVCIPAYNHEKYIEECIDSVIKQTYPNLELIIIDDGSKDKTWKILCDLKEKCEKRFKRVIFKTQKNQGTCITMNLLWRTYAQGEYIFDIASDDKLAPNAIMSLYGYIHTHKKVGLVLGKNLIMDSDGKQCYWDDKRNNVYDIKKAIYTSFTEFIEKITSIPTNSDKYGLYQYLIRDNHIANGWLIRCSVLRKIPVFTPKAPIEDWWLMLQISKFSKIHAIDETTYYYRWHSTNTIKQNTKMACLGKQTMSYERQEVQKMKNKKWALFFQDVKYTFDFYFIKLYKKNENGFRIKVLEILGKSFILKKKKYKISPNK